MNSSDYKRIGKSSLEGKWGIAIGAYFVALLLGGTVADSGFNISINSDDLSTIVDGVALDASIRAVVLTVIVTHYVFRFTFQLSLL